MRFCSPVDRQEQYSQVEHEHRQPAARSASLPRSDEAVLERVRGQIAAGHYQKALSLLKSADTDARFRNARGVCLLRLGQIGDAMRLFRELVLQPGCTWMRPDLPAAYKTNLATALLLGGHPAGCLNMLAEIHDEANPTVARLREAIRRWEASLPFWQRLSWWFGRVEPADCQVVLDFAPGDFETERQGGENPRPATPAPDRRQAA